MAILNGTSVSAVNDSVIVSAFISSMSALDQKQTYAVQTGSSIWWTIPLSRSSSATANLKSSRSISRSPIEPKNIPMLR